MSWFKKISQEDQRRLIPVYRTIEEFTQAFNYLMPRFDWKIKRAEKLDNVGLDGWWSLHYVGHGAMGEPQWRININMFSQDLDKQYDPTIGTQGLEFVVQIMDVDMNKMSEEVTNLETVRDIAQFAMTFIQDDNEGDVEGFEPTPSPAEGAPVHDPSLTLSPS